MQKQIRNFLNFIENDKKVSDNTLQSYKRDILQYENYVEQNKINYLKVNEDQIKDYLKYMNEIGKKSSTISRSLASIRSFYQYLIKEIYLVALLLIKILILVLQVRDGMVEH